MNKFAGLFMLSILLCFISITCSTGDGGGNINGGRIPGPADIDRFVVVSHPYDSSGDPSNLYELFQLSISGTLSSTGKTFEMGRATSGAVIFTPDGEVGIVAQDDGTLGVFTINSTGTPQVVHTAFSGSFHAGKLMMHPSGNYLYVLDNAWASNGGGVYKLEIGSDGRLADKGRIIEAKSPSAIVPFPGSAGSAVIAASEILNSAAADDIHLVTLEPQVARISSANPFSDDNYIIASATITHDGKYALFGDNSQFSGIANRIAVLQIDNNSLVYRQMITPVDDPQAILTSPYDNLAMVVSGIGDAIYTLTYNPINTTSPFSSISALTYVGQTPQLPASSVMIERGRLNGRVLIAEIYAIRMVQFNSAATATDIGPWTTGAGPESIVGAIGIQP